MLQRSIPRAWTRLAGLALLLLSGLVLTRPWAAPTTCAAPVAVDVSSDDADAAWLIVAVQELARDARIPLHTDDGQQHMPEGCLARQRVRVLGATPPWRLAYDLPHGGEQTVQSEDLAIAVQQALLAAQPSAGRVPSPVRTAPTPVDSDRPMDYLHSGWQALNADHLATASHDFRRAVRLFRDAGDVENTLTSLLALARTSGRGGQVVLQRTQCNAAKAMATRLGLPQLVWDAELMQAEMALAEGRADEASGLARLTLGVAQSRAVPALEQDSRIVLGESLLAAGRLREAEAVLREARRVAPRDSEHYRRVACPLQEALARQAKWHELALVQDLPAPVLRDADVDLDRVFCRGRLARLAGNPDDAEAAWGYVARQATQRGMEGLARRTAIALSTLALDRGDSGMAEPWLGVALSHSSDDRTALELLARYRALPPPRYLPWPPAPIDSGALAPAESP